MEKSKFFPSGVNLIKKLIKKERLNIKDRQTKKW
jgi:hypothetical protein